MAQKNDVTRAAEAVAQIDSEIGRTVTINSNITAVISLTSTTNIRQIQYYFTEGVETVLLPAEFNKITGNSLANPDLEGKTLIFKNRFFRTQAGSMQNILISDGVDIYSFNGGVGSQGEWRRYMTETEVSDILQGKATISATDVFDFGKDKVFGDSSTSSLILTVQYVNTSNRLVSRTATAEDLAAIGTQEGLEWLPDTSYSPNTLERLSVRFDVEQLIKKYNPNFFPADLTTKAQKEAYMQAMGAYVTFNADLVTPNFQTTHRPAAEGQPLNRGSYIYVNYQSVDNVGSNGSAFAINDPYGTNTKVWRINIDARRQLGSGQPFTPNLSGSLRSFRVYDGIFSTSASTANATTAYLRNVTLTITWDKPIENIFATRSRMDAAEKELAAQDLRIKALEG